MKIVFDARWIYDKPSGIGVYAKEILKRVPRELSNHEFIAIFSDEDIMESVFEELAFEKHSNVVGMIFPYGPLSLKSQLLLPRFLKKVGCDIFHTPNYMIPLLAFSPISFSKMKCIVNIHDIIPLVVKDYAPNSKTSKLKKVFKFLHMYAIRFADKVITGSNASKRDMQEVFSLNAKLTEKIDVIFDGAELKEYVEAESPIKTDSTSERKLLYVGRMDPYKNVKGLVEAVDIARRNVPYPLKLIVAGARDDRYPEAYERADELGLDVTFTGYVSDKELRHLYRTCDLLTHFSLYEGFGLPIVEAMCAGLPVCCTDGGSQPEVCSDAGCIIKAGDVDAFAKAIVELLNSPKTLERMRVAGYTRCHEFTWDKCAKETALLIKKLFHS